MSKTQEQSFRDAFEKRYTDRYPEGSELEMVDGNYVDTNHTFMFLWFAEGMFAGVELAAIIQEEEEIKKQEELDEVMDNPDEEDAEYLEIFESDVEGEE